MLNVFSTGEGVVRASDGARIFFTTAGEGQTTALFLHGWGGTGSGSFWSPVLRGLDRAKLRSVMVDLRGHGRSDHTRHGFTTEQFAQDVFDVANHVEAKDFILVAYSMSGRWAQWMSCTSPERVLGQILIAPVSASAMPLTEAMADNWLRSIESREGYHRFESQFTKERLAEDVLDDCFNALAGIPKFTLRETLHMCAQPGFSEKLAAVPVPTLVIGGKCDPLMSPDYLRQQVVGRIPGARLEVLDCGHNIPLEKPADIAAMIQEFVASARQGDSRAG
jgi:pimeloyl-ACP methyl ester carboxylesterase